MPCVYSLPMISLLSGVYLVRLEASGQAGMRKIVLLR